MIDINKITLKNNAMFNIVMRRPNLCKMCLERILDKKITDISYPETERTIDIDIEAKSIRLDVYCEGEDTAYDIELQNGIFEDLPIRSRYYQGMIDIDLIEKGNEYTELKNNIIIFICTFDLFGAGRHLYTFENTCIQDNSISLNDRTTKIFLNTKGTMDDIPTPLRNFLKYIDSGEVSDEYTRDLDNAVIDIRKDKRWRRKMMTVEEWANAKAKFVRKEALEEGMKKGLEKGRKEGREEGREEILAALRESLKSGITITEDNIDDILSKAKDDN